jgi:poly(A) polymerase
MERTGPIVLSRAEHCISRQNIDPDALKVLYRLTNRGFTAYLVGGGVRDLLRGEAPKDFDIGTSAHPRQIKDLFFNCFLIGRRFRLAHIRFGNKIIETSTFRRDPIEGAPEEEEPAGDLLQHHDNTFGTPEEDARRRDFTINGLFYDIKTFSVIDHVGGLEDLKAGLVRCIGQPEVRFREDPVRMLRAVRFAARLGFRIEEATYAAILRWHMELSRAAPSRLLEELYRLFPRRAGESSVRLLRETGLLRPLLPELDDSLDASREVEAQLWAALGALDRTAPPEGPPPVLIFGCLLHGPFTLMVETRRPHMPEPAAHADAAHDLVSAVGRRYHMSRALQMRLIHVFSALHRFAAIPHPTTQRGGRRFSLARVMRRDWFTDALALHRLLAEASGEDPNAVGRLLAAEATPPHMFDAVAEAGDVKSAGSGGSRRRGRRGGRRGGRGRRRGQNLPAGEGSPGDQGGEPAGASSSNERTVT